MDEFVDRATELERLRTCYESTDAELVVVFGRRRLGKTELIRESLRDRDDAIVFQATETTRQIQLEQFVSTASDLVPGVDRIERDWEPLVGFLAEEDNIVVLDEFPYLVDADPSLPSVLQRLWDHELRDTSATIVLVGSSISMMEEAALLGNSPLYGRCTEKIDLRQLPFEAALEFFPASYTAEQQVFAWGIYGGTPYYLDAIETDDDLGDVVGRTLLAERGFLRNEPEYVLRTELSEPNRYFAMLRAIAAGNATTNEIAGAIGLESKQLSTYAQKLERLRLVEREVPVTEDHVKSRRGRYRIRDPLFRFWFRFVYGFEGRYDRLGDAAYESVVEPALPDFVSEEFERLCQDTLPELFPDELFTDVGRWWYGEHEVDVVGLTTNGTMVVGECKFTNAPVGYDALSSLERHAAEIRWSPAGGEPTTEYVLFARSGFADSVLEAAEERDDLTLVDLPEILELLTSTTRE